MDKKLFYFETGFLLTMGALGMAMTIHGPVTNVMMLELNIDSAQRGFMVSLQGMGTFLSAIIWLFFGERTHKVWIIAFGTIIIIISSLFLAASFGYWGMIPVLFTYGFGFAMIDIMSNAVVLDIFHIHKKVLFHLHAAIGIGAIAGSLVAARITKELGWKYSYLVLGILTLIGLLVYISSATRASLLVPKKKLL